MMKGCDAPNRVFDWKEPCGGRKTGEMDACPALYALPCFDVAMLGEIAACVCAAE